jgi:hypothetical protein
MSGVIYKTWQAGLGAGVDCYYWRSVPVFANLTKNFSARQQTPFVSLELGANFPWIKDDEKEVQWQEFIYHRGFYGKAEIGYRLPVNAKTSFHISMGYSKKVLRADKIYYAYTDPMIPNTKFESFREHYSFFFNRISFSAGLTF